MNLIGWIFIVVGIFSTLGGVFNWEWFMNARKARFIVQIFSRTGARIFYIILGLALASLGVLGAIGIIDLSE